jgi:peptide/nickel transport system substrate-binding protein
VTEAPILPRHVYEGTDPQENPANLAPVGTGPFRFVSYDAGQELVLEANPDYFKEDVPYLDQVVMRVIPEEGNQVVALESGDVDWLFGVPGPDLERLQDRGNFGFLETAVNPGGANCIMTVSFNLERPIFQSPEVREALAHALDREQFLSRVEFGQGRVAEAPIHSGIPFAHAEGLDMPTFDRAEAERLLDEAGWVREGDGTRTAQGVEGVEDGTPLAFDFLAFPTFSQYGELVRAQLAEVGAEVRLQTLEPPVFADTVFTQRNFDTNVISYCNGTDPEIGVRRMYISSNIRPVPFSNAAAYRNPEVDRLFDEAIATVDQDERSDIYRQIQEILVEDLPYFWLVETVSTRAYRADCQGFSEAGHFAETAFCER